MHSYDITKHYERFFLLLRFLHVGMMDNITPYFVRVSLNFVLSSILP